MQISDLYRGWALVAVQNGSGWGWGFSAITKESAWNTANQFCMYIHVMFPLLYIHLVTMCWWACGSEQSEGHLQQHSRHSINTLYKVVNACASTFVCGMYNSLLSSLVTCLIILRQILPRKLTNAYSALSRGAWVVCGVWQVHPHGNRSPKKTTWYIVYHYGRHV